MSIEVETVVAVSVMMAVFSAVAAVGTSIILGAGYERLRTGFEVIRKQTGFFSDSIHKLEQKMEIVDEQTSKFSDAISTMEMKVNNVGEQANAFSGSIQKLEKKVDIVDKQTGFFGDAIHKLEKKVDLVSDHEEVVAEKLEMHRDADVISVGKTEALVTHAEFLLTQMSAIADKMSQEKEMRQDAELEFSRANNSSFAHYTHMPAIDAEEQRYN